MKTIEDLGDLRGKRVLLRCDLNVPIEDGQITDDGRIRASVPTIQMLRDAGARVVILAHLGRPKGQVNPDFSLALAAARLGELLGTEVRLADDVVGESAQALNAALCDSDVMMCENVRYEPGEESKDDAEREALAAKYAALGDVFVSDGFGVVHRKQASVYDVARLLPSAAGLLVAKEVEVCKRLTENPARPFVVVLGGSKVSDKIGVIENLLKVADRLVIAGGMGYTFLKAKGYEVGMSLLEVDYVDTAKKVMADAEARGVEIVLPTDVVTTAEFAEDADREDYPADAIPADRQGLDLGPESRSQFAHKINDAETCFWNGPLGVFEWDRFSFGTRMAALELADLAANGKFAVVGGGDSAAAVRKFGYRDDQFSHISTGGGATLEYLEGKELPGLKVLEGRA